MSRHRNVRSMNYSEEYEGFDDVYGHSVEDDYCISPSDAAFMYDRSRQQPAQISNFLAEEDDIAEEDERPVLNDLDEAKLQSCLDEVHTVVGDSVPENILIQTIVDCQFDLAKSLDTILKTQSGSQEEASKEQRVRRQRPGEKDDNSVTYGSKTFVSQLVKKNQKLKKKIKNLEAGDCVFLPSGNIGQETRNKNAHRKLKNKFGNIDKGYLHVNSNFNSVKDSENIVPQLNDPLELKHGIDGCVCKLDGFSVHSAECNLTSGLYKIEDQLKYSISKMEEGKHTPSAGNSLRNDAYSQPSIIKTSNLLERGIEIESVNCSSSSFDTRLDGFSSLTALAAIRRHDSEPSFSLDDMVADLLEDSGSDSSEHVRSPKRPNSELESDSQCGQLLGVKKILSSDDYKKLESNEGGRDDILKCDATSASYKYCQSIDSDDEEQFSLAHLAAKHEKSKSVKEDQVLSLDDLVSSHLKSDDRFPALSGQTDSNEDSLDALMAKHLLTSNEDESTCIANLTSKHLNICEPKSNENIATDSFDSPAFSARSLFGGPNVPRADLSNSINVFGNPNSSPKNIYGSPNTMALNSNTLLGSPNIPAYNIFGSSNISSKNSFGSSNSDKNSTFNTPNSLQKVFMNDTFHYNHLPSSMSPKYYNFGSSEGSSTKVDFENQRQRTISSDSRDQEMFDDADDVCFFEPTINLSSALLPSVIGENRSGRKQNETGILNQKWTAELNSALSPGSENDVLINQSDWKFPSLEETITMNVQPTEECCIDAKPILKTKLPLRAKNCSSFGKIICKRVNKSSVVAYNEESTPQTSITPFAFNSCSPDDEILKHFIRRL